MLSATKSLCWQYAEMEAGKEIAYCFEKERSAFLATKTDKTSNSQNLMQSSLTSTNFFPLTSEASEQSHTGKG